MTWRRLVAALGVFLVLEAAAFALVWGPELEELDALTVEVRTMRSEYVDKYDMAVNLAEYRKQLRELDRMFGELLVELPDRADRSFAGVRSAAAARGLRLDVLAPARSDWFRDFYVETGARIVVTGRYHQVGAFLADVGRLPASTMLETFVIERAAQPGMVTMRGVVSSYRYSTDEEMAARRAAAKR
jgi:type IV pilus assembly protein PilO